MTTRARRRDRATGRRESSFGDRYAHLPLEVVESAAYIELPDYAKTVLVAVCAQFNGHNNGDISLTAARARELGVKTTWKLRAGIQLLLASGLLEVTRPGKYSHGRGICALYALTWRDILPNDEAFPAIQAPRAASNAWARWRRPADWAKFERDIRRRARGSRKLEDDADFLRTPRGDQGGTPRRVGRSAAPDPTSGSKAGESGTPRGGHLLDLGAGAGASSAGTCDQTSADSESSIRSAPCISSDSEHCRVGLPPGRDGNGVASCPKPS